ncbi:hypothetical protein HanOQP8_Chr08g0287041 [Helianthus annuus]|nr:hypothetical protein HanLR1_Chr08g0279461 [Helianthus annuus]KAJ0722471.1 hypothetical protein HanOQP8_Chr08g0287041 [Helianthus annuus]
MRSEEATIGNIMKHEKSAAAIYCQLKRHRNQAAHIKDVLGVVATLGKVKDDNLSWLGNRWKRVGSIMVYFIWVKTEWVRLG